MVVGSHCRRPPWHVPSVQPPRAFGTTRRSRNRDHAGYCRRHHRSQRLFRPLSHHVVGRRQFGPNPLRRTPQDVDDQVVEIVLFHEARMRRNRDSRKTLPSCTGYGVHAFGEASSAECTSAYPVCSSSHSRCMAIMAMSSGRSRQFMSFRMWFVREVSADLGTAARAAGYIDFR